MSTVTVRPRLNRPGLPSMVYPFCLTLEPDWRTAPLAFWVHIPVAGSTTEFYPPAPVKVPHRGYVFLHIEVSEAILQFSSLAQLDHFIEVLDNKLLPTSRQLSAKRDLPIGPNSHWLSRLPARLKSPRERARVVKGLRAVRAQLAALGDSWHSNWHLL